MLVHLAMMLSTANGRTLPSDDKAHDSPLSRNSAITLAKSTEGVSLTPPPPAKL